MTQAEINAMRTIKDRINELASLENARFAGTEKEDEAIKTKIRPYMIWFTSITDMMEAFLTAKESGDKYDIQNAYYKINTCLPF